MAPPFARSELYKVGLWIKWLDFRPRYRYCFFVRPTKLHSGDWQWCRSVLKYGGQVKPSNYFRGLEKNSFTFHFCHKSLILDNVKLAELSDNSFEWKEFDIYRGVGGVQTYSDLPTYFQAVTTPNPRIYASRWLLNVRRTEMHSACVSRGFLVSSKRRMPSSSSSSRRLPLVNQFVLLLLNAVHANCSSTVSSLQHALALVDHFVAMINCTFLYLYVYFCIFPPVFCAFMCTRSLSCLPGIGNGFISPGSIQKSRLINISVA